MRACGGSVHGHREQTRVRRYREGAHSCSLRAPQRRALQPCACLPHRTLPSLAPAANRPSSSDQAVQMTAAVEGGIAVATQCRMTCPKGGRRCRETCCYSTNVASAVAGLERAMQLARSVLQLTHTFLNAAGCCTLPIHEPPTMSRLMLLLLKNM